MNPFVRWARFNLVGALGMAVQLTTLALVNRLTGGRYLVSTAAAVEAALLHNFVAHLRYTWRDRPAASLVVRLLRFQISNGSVSLAGNLLAMPVLVHYAKLPLLAANLIAILSCSIINFILGDQWIFCLPRNESPQVSVLHESTAEIAPARELY